MKFDEEKLRADLQTYRQFLTETDNRHYLKNHLIQREQHRQHLKAVDSRSISDMTEDDFKKEFSGNTMWSSSHSSTIANIIATNGFETARDVFARIFRYAHYKDELDSDSWDALFIKLVGRAWITEILSALNEKDFVLFNNSTSSALELYGFDYRNSSTFSAYMKACQCCKEVCRIMEDMGFEDHSMYDADGFLNYRITGWDEDTSVNSWMFTPGRNAVYWDRMYDDKEMSVGWYEIGNLDKFVTKKDMEADIRNKCPNDRSPISPWYFVYGLKKGDTVFVRKGRNTLIGYGTVNSNYEYDPSRGEYCNIRKVDWVRFDKGITIPITGMGTLSMICDKDRLRTYRKLCGIDACEENESPSDQDSVRFWTEALKEFDDGTNIEVLHCIRHMEPCTYEGLAEIYGKTPEFFENIVNDLESSFEEKYPEMKGRYGNVLTDETNLTLNETICSILSEDRGFDRPHVKKYTDNHDLNTILYGPPGTGKTYNARKLAVEILGHDTDKEDMFEAFNEEYRNKNIRFITFHQSYSYEEFIEGIRPKLNDSSKEMSYELKKGVFRKICKSASGHPFERFVLIIDEINRGDTAQIFGDMITLIEPVKRLGRAEELKVSLPYSGEEFGVPDNLYIIGTMNTADRSLTSLDAAFRRRFRFEELLPDYTPLNKKTVEGIELDKLLEQINDRLSDLTDRDHLIGQAFFCNVESIEDLRKAMCCDIIPQLQEYFPDDTDSLIHVLSRKDNDHESPFIVNKDRTAYVISKLDRNDDDPVSAFKSIYTDVNDDEDNDN